MLQHTINVADELDHDRYQLRRMLSDMAHLCWPEVVEKAIADRDGAGRPLELPLMLEQGIEFGIETLSFMSRAADLVSGSLTRTLGRKASSAGWSPLMPTIAFAIFSAPKKEGTNCAAELAGSAVTSNLARARGMSCSLR
jgi:hypothetical protein